MDLAARLATGIMSTRPPRFKDEDEADGPGCAAATGQALRTAAVAVGTRGKDWVLDRYEAAVTRRAHEYLQAELDGAGLATQRSTVTSLAELPLGEALLVTGEHVGITSVTGARPNGQGRCVGRGLIPRRRNGVYVANVVVYRSGRVRARPPRQGETLVQGVLAPSYSDGVARAIRHALRSATFV